MKDSKDEVPPDHYVLLDHTLNSMFGDQSRLRNFISRSYRIGYVRIGQIVQQTEQEYFGKVPTRPINQDKIVEGLRGVGLHFGMTAPGWKPPAYKL